MRLPGVSADAPLHQLSLSRTFCFLLNVIEPGKSSVGKSSLVNSLLNEQVARVMAFKLQADTEITTPFIKQVRANTCTMLHSSSDSGYKHQTELK
jgi:predicted GTPase